MMKHGKAKATFLPLPFELSGTMSLSMVTSPSTRRRNAYEERLLRKSKRPSLYKTSTKQKAREAALKAAQTLSKQQQEQQRSQSKPAAYHHGLEEEETSARSTEMAIRRGSLRASQEATDSALIWGKDEFVSAQDFDLNTISEDGTTMPSISPAIRTRNTLQQHDAILTPSYQTKKKKKKTLIKRISSKIRRKRFATNGNASSSSIGAVEDAWMCGCCGKVFSSQNAAEVHEDKCIRQILTKIGVNGGGVAAGETSVRPRSHHQEDPELRVRSKSVDFADRLVSSSEADLPQVGRSSSPAGQETLPHSNMLVKDRTSRRTARRRVSSETDLLNLSMPPVEEDLLLPHHMRQYMILTDEALVNSAKKAKELLLTPQEKQAERELALLSRDKAWYDMLVERAEARRTRREYNHAEGSGVVSKIQNKFVDAYKLCKEGDSQGGMQVDEYTRKRKGGAAGGGELVHTDNTVYVNVIVRHSIQVVKNELERLARERWEDMGQTNFATEGDSGRVRFERFRAIAHHRLVKLAGAALASDFTPRRVAVQLSNDLYRLVRPTLKKRGVIIEAELEYRVGQYFVLAVNVKKIDFIKLMKFTHRDVMSRRAKWEEQRKEQEKHLQQDVETEETEEPKVGRMMAIYQYFRQLFQTTGEQIIGGVLFRLYFLHWAISLPLCYLLYYALCRSTMRRYVLSTVVDDIVSYVEKKGMEMEIIVTSAKTQASFMLSALRDVRMDDRERKKKLEESEKAAKGAVLGPLLGPAIKDDKGSAPNPPPGFEMPENLEYVSLEVDLPVGFKRIRWAMLNSQSKFITDAYWVDAAKYLNTKSGSWSKHDEHIGLPTLPAGVSPDDFLGAERETEFLMPKSGFVSANMAYEKNFIAAYNDYCFCLKRATRNPDVPYGSTFVAWTQYIFINTGNDTCRMICSVEAEFPNGPPMMQGQIKSGMRGGTAQVFILLGETIEKYADEFP